MNEGLGYLEIGLDPQIDNRPRQRSRDWLSTLDITSGSIKLVRTEERFANTRLIKSLIVIDFKHEKKQTVRLISITSVQ